MERWIASVAPVAAKVASVSRSGIGEARPEVRVSTSDCASSGQRQFAPERGARRRRRPARRASPCRACRPRRGGASARPSRSRSRGRPNAAARRRCPPPCASTQSCDDGVERQRRGVDDARARRAMLEKRLRHQRAGVEADRAARDEIAAAQGDQIGRAGPGADEMHGHGAAPREPRPGKREAQVGAVRRERGPRAADCLRPRRRAPRLRRHWPRRTAPGRAGKGSGSRRLRARSASSGSDVRATPSQARGLDEPRLVRLGGEA